MKIIYADFLPLDLQVQIKDLVNICSKISTLNLLEKPNTKEIKQQREIKKMLFKKIWERFKTTKKFLVWGVNEFNGIKWELLFSEKNVYMTLRRN